MSDFKLIEEPSPRHGGMTDASSTKQVRQARRASNRSLNESNESNNHAQLVDKNERILKNTTDDSRIDTDTRYVRYVLVLTIICSKVRTGTLGSMLFLVAFQDYGEPRRTYGSVRVVRASFIYSENYEHTCRNSTLFIIY